MMTIELWNIVDKKGRENNLRITRNFHNHKSQKTQRHCEEETYSQTKLMALHRRDKITDQTQGIAKK